MVLIGIDPYPINSTPGSSPQKGSTPLKNMTSSVGMSLFPIYGKTNNVPNHQPVINYIIFMVDYGK